MDSNDTTPHRRRVLRAAGVITIGGIGLSSTAAASGYDEHKKKDERVEVVEEPEKKERVEVVEEPEKKERVEVVEEPEKKERVEVVEEPEKKERVKVVEEPEKKERVEVVEEPKEKKKKKKKDDEPEPDRVLEAGNARIESYEDGHRMQTSNAELDTRPADENDDEENEYDD